jgi:hypothetical protein
MMLTNSIYIVGPISSSSTASQFIIIMPSYVWYLLSFPRTRNPKMTRESHIRRVCDGVGSRKKETKNLGLMTTRAPASAAIAA